MDTRNPWCWCMWGFRGPRGFDAGDAELADEIASERELRAARWLRGWAAIPDTTHGTGMPHADPLTPLAPPQALTPLASKQRSPRQVVSSLIRPTHWDPLAAGTEPGARELRAQAVELVDSVVEPRPELRRDSLGFVLRMPGASGGLLRTLGTKSDSMDSMDCPCSHRELGSLLYSRFMVLTGGHGLGSHPHPVHARLQDCMAHPVHGFIISYHFFSLRPLRKSWMRTGASIRSFWGAAKRGTV